MPSSSGIGPLAAGPVNPSPLPVLSPRALGVLAAVITVLVWTAFIIVARAMALRSLTPLDIAFCRILGASLVLLPWGYYLVQRMRAETPQAATWLGLSPLPMRLTVGIGLVGGVGYAVLAYNAFVYAPAAHGSVLMPGMLPLSTSLLAVWVLGERLQRNRIIGLSMIFGGAMLVGGASLLKAFDGGSVWRGDLMFVGASSCWATYTVLCRKHQLQAVPATIAVIVFSAVSFVPVYLALVAGGVLQSHLLQAPWGDILFQILWQGGGSVVISGIAFTRMVEHFGPVRSTMVTAVVPGLSALGAVLFLGEPLYWNLVAGLVLVTAGIVVGVRSRSVAA